MSGRAPQHKHRALPGMPGLTAHQQRQLEGPPDRQDRKQVAGSAASHAAQRRQMKGCCPSHAVGCAAAITQWPTNRAHQQRSWVGRAGPPRSAREAQPLGSLRAEKACWCANRKRAGRAVPPVLPPHPEQLPLPLQESLKSRVDGASSKAAGSDTASDAGSLGESTAIERRLEPSSSAPCPDSDATPPFSWRGLLQFCGSGLLMSVAYLVGGPRWHGRWVLPWHPCSALQPSQVG